MLQGQQWINRVRLCLQDKMLSSSVYAKNGSCDQLSSAGYGSHAHCYVDNGFCDTVLMNNQNLNALFKVVSLRDLTWPPDAVRSICDIMKLCNELDKHHRCQDDTCQSDIKENTAGGSMLLTRIAQLAAKHPILSKIACDLYK